jgi:DNA invertase Pin-like site-specific DNA recombinase
MLVHAIADSGAKTHRPGLEKAVSFCRKGDTCGGENLIGWGVQVSILSS